MSSAVQICRTRLGNVLLRQQPVRGWRGPSLSLALARHPRSSQLAAGSSFRNATTLSTAGKNAHSQNHTADEKSQNENGSSSSEQNQSQQGRVLYERRPDWYIRLIPLLIVLDIAMLYVPLPVYNVQPPFSFFLTICVYAHIMLARTLANWL